MGGVQITVVDHPLALQALATLRDQDTGRMGFRHAMDDLASLLVYEATRSLRTETFPVTTPLTETTTLVPYGEIPKAVAEVCDLTWSCEAQDIHPRSKGYARIAELIVAALPERA